MMSRIEDLECEPMMQKSCGSGEEEEENLGSHHPSLSRPRIVGGSLLVATLLAVVLAFSKDGGASRNMEFGAVGDTEVLATLRTDEDQVVYFRFALQVRLEDAEKIITKGQQFKEIEVNDPDKRRKSANIKFIAGRKGSESVAKFFTDGLDTGDEIRTLPSSDSHAKYPEKLNSAIKGTLSIITVDGHKCRIPDFRLAQGHNSGGHDWWIASNACHRPNVGDLLCPCSAGRLARFRRQDDQTFVVVAEMDTGSTAKELVSGLYTFGAPGTATYALQNFARPDGCFHGVRAFLRDHAHKPNDDPVVVMTNLVGFQHAYYNAYAAIMGNPGESEIALCTETTKNERPKISMATGGGRKPLTQLPDSDLVNFVHFNDGERHKVGNYLKTIHATKHDNVLDTMVTIAAEISYALPDKKVETNQKTVAAAKELGFNIVGVATIFKGFKGDGFLGSGASWLLQNPSSFDCVLTFMGTANLRHVEEDLKLAKSDFCGYPGVHAGFRESLIRMIGSDSFKDNIHAKLPKCRKVSVVGHSLGAAKAELFSACANRAFTEAATASQDQEVWHSMSTPWEDHAMSSWVPSEPEAMPEMSKADLSAMP